MGASEILLYSSGRFPPWFRVPAVLFGMFALWIGVSILAEGAFGVRLGFGTSDGRGSWMLGSLASLLIGVLWMFAWVAHRRVLYDPARHELVNRTESFFRSYEQRFSLAGAKEIRLCEVRYGGMHGGHKRRAVGVFADGRTSRLTEIPAGDVRGFAAVLENAAKVPVKMVAET